MGEVFMQNANRKLKILLLGCWLWTLPGCTLQLPQLWGSTDSSGGEGILQSDMYFEIDPEKGIFSSRQSITVSGGLVKDGKFNLYIGESLQIDRLTLEDADGHALAVKDWKKTGNHNIEYFWGISKFAILEIQTAEDIPADGRLIVNLEYHLPAEAIQAGLAENLYALFVSPRGSHAGGPESGAFPLVDGNLEAPFSITIKHPENITCAVPGELQAVETTDGFKTVTYRSDIPYDPSFSCAPYKVTSTETENMRIELFTPVPLDHSPAMLASAAQILSFYAEKFGTPPARSFKIVFPELAGEGAGGESNGNLVLLGDIKPFLDYDEAAQDSFTQLISHEGYHLWNTWGLTWEGSLAEWWVEGGANFMASWSKEELFGSEAGAKNRLNHLQGFSEQEAYRYGRNLANLDDGWFESWALVYDYGALVWEQLRQEMGSEPLSAGLRDFYGLYAGRATGYEEFIACLQTHTTADVAATLSQWTRHNARIDLTIQDVAVLPENGRFHIRVDVQIDADRDYHFSTALGYKTSAGKDWKLIDMHVTKAGLISVEFESDERPVEIRIDPEYRVPQIKPDDNLWIAGSTD
jgi:aminopeptidase N